MRLTLFTVFTFSLCGFLCLADDGANDNKEYFFVKLPKVSEEYLLSPSVLSAAENGLFWVPLIGGTQSLFTFSYASNVLLNLINVVKNKDTRTVERLVKVLPGILGLLLQHNKFILHAGEDVSKRCSTKVLAASWFSSLCARFVFDAYSLQQAVKKKELFCFGHNVGQKESEEKV